MFIKMHTFVQGALSSSLSQYTLLSQYIVSKQIRSHWIVDAIMAAYMSQGLECPLHIRANSTRAIASSGAWSRGMSIQDICLAAGWSSQNTFARFYKLDVQSLASQVLSVSS